MPYETPKYADLYEGQLKKGGQNRPNTSNWRPDPPVGSNPLKVNLTDKLVSACRLIENLDKIGQLPNDVQIWWTNYLTKQAQAAKIGSQGNDNG